MAGGEGLEPSLTGPEPVVLPLDDPPPDNRTIYYNTQIYRGQGYYSCCLLAVYQRLRNCIIQLFKI